MARAALLAVLAAVAVASASAALSSTIVSTDRTNVRQLYSMDTSSVSTGWTQVVMDTTGISSTTSFSAVALCKYSGFAYVFLGQSTNVYMRKYTMGSNGMLSAISGESYTAITTGFVNSVQSVSCIDNSLYIMDTAGSVRYLSDFTASSLSPSAAFDSSDYSQLASAQQMFISTTGSLLVDVYFGADSSTSSEDGVYSGQFTRTGSSFSTSAGHSSASQWSNDHPAYGLAIDTSGTAWYTASGSNAGTIYRATDSTSTTTSTTVATGLTQNGEMRYSNSRLYFASSSTVWFYLAPFSTTSVTTGSSTNMVGLSSGHSASIDHMAVYYEGAAVRALPSMAALLIPAALVALLSRRFW